jgi:hypothetical protein
VDALSTTTISMARAVTVAKSASMARPKNWPPLKFTTTMRTRLMGDDEGTSAGYRLGVVPPAET